MKLERFVLTTDFSPAAREAYGVAAELARRSRGRIDLVRCVDYPFQYPFAGFDGAEGAYLSYRNALQARLEAEVRDVRLEGVTVEAHLLDGYGPEAVARLASEKKADLVVQGSRGHTGLKRLLLGSFAEAVIRESEVPVLTIRAGHEAGEERRSFEPKRILFPHDFSACSLEALPTVRFLAQTFGARVHLLHVCREIPELPLIPGIAGEPVSAQLLNFHDQQPEKLLGELTELAARELGGIPHSVQVMTGSPATLIVARAATLEADVICLATHGWRGWKRVLMGSVAEKVVRLAQCPTLTVRPTNLRTEPEPHAARGFSPAHSHPVPGAKS